MLIFLFCFRPVELDRADLMFTHHPVAFFFFCSALSSLIYRLGKGFYLRPDADAAAGFAKLLQVS